MATIQAIDQVMDQYNKYEFKGTIYESDIWDCEILGLQKSSVHSMYKLNFTTLYPSWLRLITKQFIKFILNTKQFSTALSWVFLHMRRKTPFTDSKITKLCNIYLYPVKIKLLIEQSC